MKDQKNGMISLSLPSFHYFKTSSAERYQLSSTGAYILRFCDNAKLVMQTFELLMFADIFT